MLEGLKRVWSERHHHRNGKEVVDPTPHAIHVDLAPLSQEDRLKAMLESERFMAQARASGMETIEEANDFDIRDDAEDEMLATAYELFGLEMEDEVFLDEEDVKPDEPQSGSPSEEVPQGAEDEAKPAEQFDPSD